MSPLLLLGVFCIYTLLIFVISWLTSRKANDDVYYRGNRQSPWYVVAYGMIGASLSGVTFLSEPGWVKDTQFSYMMVVLGYAVGYIVIVAVLLPLYYRLNLTSIYSYLGQRFGKWSYRTGASFFILSRLVGSSLRMFLTVYILYIFVFQHWGVPFFAVSLIFVVIILLYTFRGGIKTVVWTDTLQTTFMLASVAISIFFIGREMGWGVSEIITRVRESEYSTMLVTDWTDERFYLKQFLSGIFITIVMTGLDQDMMQKNLTCRNLRDARKNMLSFTAILLVINLLFLSLGAVLMMYVQANGIEILESDRIFAFVAIHRLGVFAGIVFVIGLISAAYSSADGTLTAITTSFCIDIIELDQRDIPSRRKIYVRYAVHFSVALLSLLLITGVKQLDNTAIISRVFTIAGYTYGPLLGLYAFGLCTKRKVHDKAVPVIALLSPVVSYLLNAYSQKLLWGYKFGFELLIVNGFITFAGLWLCRQKRDLFSAPNPDVQVEQVNEREQFNQVAHIVSKCFRFLKRL
ncbi:MAG: sodium:solute symporter [Bacteroidales bacterium]|jgi:Na+/proline symporter|nr:sodium:solute symporter [Bacteroidales bacterium]